MRLQPQTGCSWENKSSAVSVVMTCLSTSTRKLFSNFNVHVLDLWAYGKTRKFPAPALAVPTPLPELPEPA
eukprot:1606165-Amphidinium_carterae.1